jgi:hypothetical protein
MRRYPTRRLIPARAIPVASGGSLKSRQVLRDLRNRVRGVLQRRVEIFDVFRDNLETTVHDMETTWHLGEFHAFAAASVGQAHAASRCRSALSTVSTAARSATGQFAVCNLQCSICNPLLSPLRRRSDCHRRPRSKARGKPTPLHGVTIHYPLSTSHSPLPTPPSPRPSRVAISALAIIFSIDTMQSDSRRTCGAMTFGDLLAAL